MSSYKRDKIVVIDCEMSCWSNKEEQGNQSSEIIQIGLCSFNITTEEIEQATSYLIKPKYSTISEYCSALTGLTPKIMKGAIPLSDACNSIMKNFGSRGRVFATFGDDKTKFREDCLRKNANYPFGNYCIDVSLWFHLKYRQKNNLSLAAALENIDLEFKGKPHNALIDAVNTAKLLQHLIS